MLKDIFTFIIHKISISKNKLYMELKYLKKKMYDITIKIMENGLLNITNDIFINKQDNIP